MHMSSLLCIVHAYRADSRGSRLRGAGADRPGAGQEACAAAAPGGAAVR